MSLVQKLRKAREVQVQAGGYTFTVRRPTDVQMMALSGQGVEALVPYVVGWEGVREIDVLPSGDAHPLDFDAAVCAEWLADRIDLLSPLADAIIAAYKAHAETLEAAAKN
jgi:hypothetical protein